MLSPDFVGKRAGDSYLLQIKGVNMAASNTDGKTRRGIATLIKSVTRRGYDVEVNCKSSRYTMVIKHPYILSDYVTQILTRYGFKPIFCYIIPTVSLNNTQLHQSVFELDLAADKSHIKSRKI
jgi:hypothetical protein